jgi:hypothetical protein
VSGPRPAEPARVRDEAARLLRELAEPLPEGAALGEPIPVRTALDELDSWFVPVTAEDELHGFLQLEPDLRLHRYSTFPPERPSAASWLDPKTIIGRARTAVGENERLEQPSLSFHGSRDRLAWRVPLADRRASVYVVGAEVYLGEP